MISYAGTELVHGDEALLARLEDGLRLRWPFSGSPWSQPRLPGTDAAFAAPGLWPPHDCRLNVLHWPTGASRWAWGLFLADDAAIAAARLAESQQGYADFVFADGATSVTTRLLMLPPIPAERIADGVPGLYVLPLVDERYSWWLEQDIVAITGGSTTWAALYAAIGTALGITITADTVAGEYLYPSPGLSLAPGPIPPLLDLVAASCGQRIVRRFDGTVAALNASTSLALHGTNLAYLEEPARLRLLGDRQDIRQRPGLDDDRTLNVPATFRLSFARGLDGVPDPDDPYAADVTLSSLALPEYGGGAGRPGLVHTEYSSALASTGSSGMMMPFPPFLGDGETPSNKDELDALAERAATDWYLWQLGCAFAEYAGAPLWTLDAHSDLVELRHLPERVSSAIFPGDRRPLPGACWLGHHSASFGSYIPPSRGNAFYGSTVYASGSSATFQSGSGLVLLSGSSIHVYAPSWDFHEDFTFSIATGKTVTWSGGSFAFSTAVTYVAGSSSTYASGSSIVMAGPSWGITANTTTTLGDGVTWTIAGGAKVLVNSPLEICGWQYWCHAAHALAATEDDWDGVSDEDKKATVHLLVPVANCVLSGMVPRGDKQLAVLVNASSYRITLKHDATSTAANRFGIAGSTDLVLRAGESAICWYDPTVTRWIVLADFRNGLTADIEYASVVECNAGALDVTYRTLEVENGIMRGDS